MLQTTLALQADLIRAAVLLLHDMRYFPEHFAAHVNKQTLGEKLVHLQEENQQSRLDRHVRNMKVMG